jgi:hypothetical protein
MTFEGYDGDQRTLLSYDVSGLARPRASRVCHIVFGRVRKGADGTEILERGYIHRPGVVWIGQSVLILPSRDAEELAGKLRSLDVRVASSPVGISSVGLRAFRRPRGWGGLR